MKLMDARRAQDMLPDAHLSSCTPIGIHVKHTRPYGSPLKFSDAHLSFT
jgi:hypothetical protein